MFTIATKLHRELGTITKVMNAIRHEVRRLDRLSSRDAKQTYVTREMAEREGRRNRLHMLLMCLYQLQKATEDRLRLALQSPDHEPLRPSGLPRHSLDMLMAMAVSVGVPVHH